MQINKKISKYNFNPGTTNRIKYIVIHYTGSLGDAENQASYFAGGNRGASAHYFVGYKGDIWQSVDDSNIAWHCGSKKYRHPVCRNANSLGIEMCAKTKGDPTKADENWYFEDATVKATIELVKELMDKYHIRPFDVIRHYDVTGKICPAPYVFNNGEHTWEEFQMGIEGKEVHFKPKYPVKKETKTTDNNKSVIWDFLTNHCDLNDFAAAGVMGNLYAESGLKSTNLQNSFEKKFGMNDEQYTTAVDDGTYSKDSFIKDKAGYGLAQWTFHSRKKALYEFMKSKKLSIGDLEGQLLYFWNEVTANIPLYTRLKAARSVKEASDVMLHVYEKPADQSATVENKRAAFGQAFFDEFSK